MPKTVVVSSRAPKAGPRWGCARRWIGAVAVLVAGCAGAPPQPAAPASLPPPEPPREPSEPPAPTSEPPAPTSEPPPAPCGGEPMTVAFLDAGQALAALVTLPDGRHLLVDAGESPTREGCGKPCKDWHARVLAGLERHLQGAPIDLPAASPRAVSGQ